MAEKDAIVWLSVEKQNRKYLDVGILHCTNSEQMSNQKAARLEGPILT